MSDTTNVELAAFSEDEIEIEFFRRFDRSDIKDMCYGRGIMEEIYEGEADLADFTVEELINELESRNEGVVDSETLRWLETYIRIGDVESATHKLYELIPALEYYSAHIIIRTK